MALMLPGTSGFVFFFHFFWTFKLWWVFFVLGWGGVFVVGLFFALGGCVLFSDSHLQY